MVDQIFELFKAQPALSIVLGFLLTGFLSFVFKGVIVDYIKKKYNLYTEQEVRSAFISTINISALASEEKNKLGTLKEKVIRKLTENRVYK